MTKLYERYAEEIAALIAQGELAPGTRIPSVREASTRRGISASTVFQAYHLLEARGLIHSRPQSGYYVSAPLANAASRPRISAPPRQSTSVAISDLVFDVIDAARSRSVAPLGSAFPSPELFPLARLARSAAIGLRQLDPASIVDHLSPGNRRLREQIALRYRVDGIRVEHDEIVVTNGALEALNIGLQAVTRPGDTVAVESPTFYAALQALERLGLKALEIPTDPAEGADPDALAEALDRHAVAACWLMPNFQNPLGSLMPETRKQALVDVLARRGIPLIEDDVYGELYFGGQRPRPAKAFDRDGLVMHCASFSKSLAPGYRVGWIAAGRFARAVERGVLMTTLSASVPAQTAVVHYLEQGGYDRHLRRLRATLAQQMLLAVQAVPMHFPEGTRFARPRGGYFLWLELPHTVDAMALYRAALDEGIGIAPGHIFSPDHRFRHNIRLNCGHPGAGFLPALQRVGALAIQLSRKTP